MRGARSRGAVPAAALTPLLALVAAGCGEGTGRTACRAHEQAGLQSTAFLGAATPGRMVTDAAWRQFVDDTVSVRLPDGFTVLEGAGRWRDARGRIHGEPTRLLVVVHPRHSPARGALDAIARQYARRFRQQSVLIVSSPACIAVATPGSP